METRQNYNQNISEHDNGGIPIRPPGLLEKKLLEMITHAAAGEAAAREYYMRLSDMLISSCDKRTVYDIALDETKHYRLFDELYLALCGERMPKPNMHDLPESTIPGGNLPAIFEERLHDELHDVEFYRQIYFALNNVEFRDILFEIITDELRHAHLMNLLYAKYKD